MRNNISKLLVVALLLSVAFSFAACGGGGGAPAGDDDSGRETLIAGVTLFEPMNFLDDDDEWTGFETEFALAVGEILDVNVEFQMIEWANKFIELDSGAIDMIWNGMTATAIEASVGVPRAQLCDMSYSYMLNTQSVVVRADRADEFAEAEDLKGLTIAAEAGSAGESKAQALAGMRDDDPVGNFIGVPKQINTFIEVKTGAVDAAVIDIILAEEMVGKGDFTDLVISDIDLGDEWYAIGFRSGDPLKDRVNEAILQLYEDGTLMAIATKWGLEDRLVIDTSWGQW